LDVINFGVSIAMGRCGGDFDLLLIEIGTLGLGMFELFLPNQVVFAGLEEGWDVCFFPETQNLLNP
jgi:hypothetical protein